MRKSLGVEFLTFSLDTIRNTMVSAFLDAGQCYGYASEVPVQAAHHVVSTQMADQFPLLSSRGAQQDKAALANFMAQTAARVHITTREFPEHTDSLNSRVVFARTLTRYKTDYRAMLAAHPTLLGVERDAAIGDDDDARSSDADNDDQTTLGHEELQSSSPQIALCDYEPRALDACELEAHEPSAVE